MMVDGRKIADDVYSSLLKKVATLKTPPRLTVLTCDPHFETKKYLALKQKRAEALGIDFRLIKLPPENTTEDMVANLKKVSKDTDAIVVQLPLPSHIDKEKVCAHIPVTLDVDALNPKTTVFLSPVVRAIEHILGLHDVDAKGKHIVVIGTGALVGRPAAQWFRSAGGAVTVVSKATEEIEELTKKADILVSGAGVPRLIKPTMLKEGVILLDAGTSEEGGELRGDADSTCAPKCALFTPVPGGIGPITVAMLLKNVVDSAERRQSVL